MSRRVATEKIRNKGKYLDPAIMEMEKSFTETLGTRVRIERVKEGGTVVIDFFSPDDLRVLLEKLVSGGNSSGGNTGANGGLSINEKGGSNLSAAVAGQTADSAIQSNGVAINTNTNFDAEGNVELNSAPLEAIDDRAPADIEKQDNEDMYSLKDFSL